MKKILLTFLTCLFLLLAFIGTLLPVMPTVPFLLAALFFAGKSPDLQNKLMRYSFIRKFIALYKTSDGVSRRFKYFSVILLWLSLGFSALLSGSNRIRIILLLVGIAVSWHLLSLKERKK
jgi:uncharacterized membrane protein YbaN (DUF454 family)